MSVEQVIATYGYVAILVGTLLEGETVLILAGFLAHRGYLELPWVLVAAFAGTFVGDQSLYFLGRRKGRAFLETRPGWKVKMERVTKLLHEHQILLLLGFRFLYGLRTVTPLLIGVSGLRPRRVVVCNFVGAVVWTIALGMLGYFFGQATQAILGRVKRYEVWIAVGIVAVGAAMWVARWLRGRGKGESVECGVQD
ncbi:MAG: DedA family protein [Planctomycetota bacterium]